MTDLDLAALRAKAEDIKSLPSFGASMTINGELWFDVILALLARIEEADAVSDQFNGVVADRNEEITRLRALLARAGEALKSFGCDCTGRCQNHEWLPAGAQICMSVSANQLASEIEEIGHE